ncbi:hypothetical protein ABBZ21_19785 [Acinetobacter baumannii]|uniref:hypothetical protein n=1 Tax=Acinetobacter baumannii TaxID=470 RepID=UPI00385C6E3E
MNNPKDSFSRVIFAGSALALIGAFTFGFIGFVCGLLIKILFNHEVNQYALISAFAVIGFILAIVVVIHTEITDYIKSKKNKAKLNNSTPN